MVTKVKYLILGAGPSGLAFATRLKQLGETSFLLLEKESEAGGLCRSKEVDGAPLDIGGGHFLDVRKTKVVDFLFDFLPKEEWNQFDRISKIRTDRFEIDYPYEANIWQLSTDDQIRHLVSIMNSGSSRDTEMPQKFKDWIIWKLGDVIAQDYMLPYNEKIFSGIDINDLGTYWLYKLPDVSFEAILRSCLTKEPYGNIPAHACFYYPKEHGYGEVFLRVANTIKENLRLDTPVKTIDIETLTVNDEFQGEKVITTIPWHEIVSNQSIPNRIKDNIEKLKYTSVDIAYQSKNEATSAHWTYFPSKQLPYHRALYRHNFIKGAQGYWQEINAARTTDDLTIINHNKYAYPLNTIDKPQAIEEVIDWAKSKSIIGLGRWGEWVHMNSDVAVEKGMLLAESFVRS
ncbi:MAG: NAD(P)-binding protein [Chloroflexi bacterium]|nr:NAD(P)-binding protein [Chloroflexota bacterium]